MVGDLDLVVGETLRFAQTLLRDGVPTELHIYPGAYHGFTIFSEAPAIVQRARRDLWSAIQRGFQQATDPS